MHCFIQHSLDSFNQIIISYPKAALIFLNEMDNLIRKHLHLNFPANKGSSHKTSYQP